MQGNLGPAIKANVQHRGAGAYRSVAPQVAVLPIARVDPVRTAGIGVQSSPARQRNLPPMRVPAQQQIYIGRFSKLVNFWRMSQEYPDQSFGH